MGGRVTWDRKRRWTSLEATQRPPHRCRWPYGGREGDGGGGCRAGQPCPCSHAGDGQRGRHHRAGDVGRVRRRLAPCLVVVYTITSPRLSPCAGRLIPLAGILLHFILLICFFPF
ncbi:hypothetical protein DAI22_07g100350 [Oryza sativa Japonica Group]|nr:hypothetical protein DAI22_07g100350 [Oryza sativa Japonica Group]